MKKDLAKNSSDPAPAIIDRARQMLAEATTLDQILHVRGVAMGAEQFFKAAGHSRQVAQQAAEVRLRAERKAGEVLIDMRKKGERTKGGGNIAELQRATQLSDLGVEKTQSHRWQQIAGIPERVFESYIADAKADPLDELTTAALVKQYATLRRREERTEMALDLEDEAAPLGVDRQYPVIVVDPPWRYDFAESDARAIENQYPTLSLEELKNLTLDEQQEIYVSDVASPDSVLFMWATSPKLLEAMVLLDAWGFEYRTNMVWVKDKIGMGYYARAQHELLLIAKRGDLPVPEPGDRPSSVIQAPREAHSRKPDVFFDVIDRMYPGLPKMELFGRGAARRPGWFVWGNQAVVNGA